MGDMKHYKRAEEYWDKLLGDYITLARFPNDFFNEDTGKFSLIQKTIKRTPYENLLRYCDENSLSFEAVLDTVFGIVLQRFTHEDDVVFGKTDKWLPMRLKIDNTNVRFIDVCRQVMDQSTESKEFDYFMMAPSGFKTGLNEKLINTLFIYEVKNDKNVSQENMQKIDIYMKVSISNEMRIKLAYKPSFYDKSTARSIIYLFKYILTQIVNNKDIKIKDIQSMKEEHKQIFIRSFNENLFDFDPNIGYVELLKKQVEKTPDNIAICDYKEEITYREMDRITDKIAGYLNHLGIRKGDTVAVLQERDKNVVISAISILKAGAIFFPIDKTNPDERLGYLLEDGQTKLILTCDSQMLRIGEKHSGYSVLDINNPDLLDHEYSMTQSNEPTDEAYGISTSGTTGRPKCISVRHESLLNMCYYSNNYISADENDRCGIYLSFSFDAIMKQIFPYLLVGASVDIIPEVNRKNERTVEVYCQRKGITILALPAILGKLFMTNCPCPGLRVLQVGGDKFKGYVERTYKIINEYGPAEFTVLCSSFEVDKFYENVPVGKPIYNTEAYILDNNNNVCAIGVPGELCLSGIQIANGYLNKEEQNERSFVDNPFKHNQYTEKMYRTGDLAKWIDDEGTISILGRMDSQVQIKGIRIELFEIENMINMISEIKNSVVINKEDRDGDTYLDAYYEPFDGYYPPEKVKEFLEENLPPHMLPRHIMCLDHLPVTPIGKVDKKSLPIIENKE